MIKHWGDTLGHNLVKKIREERLMSKAELARKAGVSPLTMDRVKKGVEKVTKEDVLRVAKKYLRPDKVQILVVGKKEDFDKPLSTLGEVNVIDIKIPRLKREEKK